jgi:hypothetical protein
MLVFSGPICRSDRIQHILRVASSSRSSLPQLLIATSVWVCWWEGDFSPAIEDGILEWNRLVEIAEATLKSSRSVILSRRPESKVV